MPRPAPHVYGGTGRLPEAFQGSAMVLGSFDGLHRGHMALVRAAAARGGLVSALQCDPHPRAFFSNAAGFRISTGRAQHHLLAAAGVGLVYAPRFDAEFAATSAEDFVHWHLFGRLGVSAVVTGRDFRFGAGRQGDVGLLELMGRTLGFAVVTVADECDGTERISSSRIRAEIAQGRIGRAARLIGHPWILAIDHGGGEDWRFPPEQLLPPDGAYAVEPLDAEGRGLGTAILRLAGRRAQMDAPAATTMIALGQMHGMARDHEDRED